MAIGNGNFGLNAWGPYSTGTNVGYPATTSNIYTTTNAGYYFPTPSIAAPLPTYADYFDGLQDFNEFAPPPSAAELAAFDSNKADLLALWELLK